MRWKPFKETIGAHYTLKFTKRKMKTLFQKTSVQITTVCCYYAVYDVAGDDIPPEQGAAL